MRLDGKTAVVMGAGHGIGREISLAMAREGAAVVLAGRSHDALVSVRDAIHAAGGSSMVVLTDLREPDQVTALAATVEREMGPTDILVNNSGVSGPVARLWEIDPADWDDTLRVNLTGVFLTCRAFLPSMLDREGSIIVIGSVVGKSPLPRRSAYAASKLGLLALVRTLAWDAGAHGVRVNLISPGATMGERVRGFIGAQAQARGVSADIVRSELSDASPLRRLVEPQDIAATAVFLASDEARAITGEDINVASGSVMY